MRHAVEKGTAPALTSWKELIWKDASGTANSDNLGIVGNAYFADGHAETFLRVYTPLSGSDNNASIPGMPDVTVIPFLWSLHSHVLECSL